MEKKGYRPVRIAVNISPMQFKQLNFPNKIESVLKKYEVDPQFIELEITESSMENVEETEEILKKLKKLGVYVSVDDFGTGYSSLSYLKNTRLISSKSINLLFRILTKMKKMKP